MQTNWKKENFWWRFKVFWSFCYLDETKTDLETLVMYLAFDIVLHIDSKDTIRVLALMKNINDNALALMFKMVNE